MSKEHLYTPTIKWTGNRGSGTSHYAAYSRDHIITIAGKPDILGSSDPAFRGSKDRHNPEDNLVSAISACHMLSYLHLCAVNNIIVEQYIDHATGTMVENADGSAQFSEIVLKPIVTVKEKGMVGKALSLHHDANKICFIARSVNFPVLHHPEIIVQ